MCVCVCVVILHDILILMCCAYGCDFLTCNFLSESEKILIETMFLQLIII